MNRKTPIAVLIVLVTVPFASCESPPRPGTDEPPAVSAAGTAAASAAIEGKGNRIASALIGSTGGAAGSLIGAKTDWFATEDGKRQARQAIERARQKPATVEDVARAQSADLNSDGFVTFDELVAMKQAQLDDEDLLQRLHATGQVYDLTAKQKQALIDAGISPYVAAEMTRINEPEKNRVLANAPSK